MTSCVKYDVSTPPVAGQPTRCLEDAMVTIGQIIYNSLNAPDPALTPDSIVMRGALARKIRAAKDMDLSSAQRDAVKAAIFNAVLKLNYTPALAVQVIAIVDPAAIPKDK